MEGRNENDTWAVTGANGFLGRHILHALRATDVRGRRVIGLSRMDGAGQVGADLLDREALSAVLQQIRPNVLIHAAGTTRTGDADACYNLNIRATLNLFEALRELNRPVRVVLLGSAAELGTVPIERLPVGPEYPARPVSPYGLSKYLATCAGLAAAEPLDVRIARIFNPVGPGLPASQAFGRFATILRVEQSRDPIILRVGEIDSRRDFVDVRDVASAVLAIADRGHTRSLYHVGTGESHSVREGLEQLIALSGRAVDVQIVLEAPGRSGPADSRADNRSLKDETGWMPRISFDQSLHDLWEATTAAIP